MNTAFLFYATISLFGIVYIVLALLPKKKIKTKTDYFLAGRNLTVFKATCTLIATQLGAGLLLGTSQQAYSMGLYSLLFTFGISIGLILLGCGIASRLRSLGVVTTTEVFQTRYNSPGMRMIASLLVTFTLCGILVGNMVAAKLLMRGLGFTSVFFYVLFWLFIIGYTMVGGLHAVVLTDLVQVTFIVITFVGIVAYSLFSFPHSFSFAALGHVQKQFSGHLPSASTLMPILLMPALFALFEQDLAQIFFASKTKKVATWAAILTTIFMLTFGLIPIYLGMQAKLMGVVDHQSPLLGYIKTIANPFVLVMVASGILAAIASTADALLCAIGANITQDFSLHWIKLPALIKSKVTILFVGSAMLALSFIMPSNIIAILVKSYEVPVDCLLIPILGAYFLPQVSRSAGIGGLVGGAFGLLLFHVIIPVEFAALYALGLSLICYGIGFFVQKKVQ